MKSSKTFRAICFLIIGGSFILTSQSFSQDRALQQLIQGKKYFWEAKFDQAMNSLKQVVGVPDAKTEYLFEAYLYMGFVLTRQNAPLSEVNSAFEQAVKMDPKRQLDELVIPPDLTEKFNAVRDQLVGCLYVTTEPIDANLMVVQNDSIMFNTPTPTVLCELVNRNYQLLLSKENYEEQFMPLNLTAGTTDTLFVTLKPSVSSQKSKGKGPWGWVARGGIVAAAAAVLYKTVIESGDENLEELPAPPDRPSQ